MANMANPADWHSWSPTAPAWFTGSIATDAERRRGAMGPVARRSAGEDSHARWIRAIQTYQPAPDCNVIGRQLAQSEVLGRPHFAECSVVADSPDGAPGIVARRALVFHDREVVVDVIRLTLNHGAFVVRAAVDLQEADAVMDAWHPHMAILDMDHDDSSAFLQRLATTNTIRGSATPVLGLTRRGDLETKLKAFDLGVDDILTTPFSPEELLARAMVITRRVSGLRHPIVPVIQVGDIELDIVKRQVRAGQTVVSLSGIEQSLLYLLASRPGQVIGRETILDHVWGTDFVAESNVVDRHVRTLRIKLNDDYRHPRFIASVPGLGYRFVPAFSNCGWDQGDPSAT